MSSTSWTVCSAAVASAFTSSSAGTNIQNLSDMGIAVARSGELVVDDAKLDSALANNYADVVQIFSANTDDQAASSDAAAGLAGDINKLITNATDTDSYLVTQQETLATANSTREEELSDLADRMERVEERYNRQFLAMQQIIDQMNEYYKREHLQMEEWEKRNGFYLSEVGAQRCAGAVEHLAFHHRAERGASREQRHLDRRDPQGAPRPRARHVAALPRSRQCVRRAGRGVAPVALRADLADAARVWAAPRPRRRRVLHRRVSDQDAACRPRIDRLRIG